MFKFQRKHSVGGKAKKAVFTFHTEKKVIDDNPYPIVKDNEKTGFLRYRYGNKRQKIFPEYCQR